MPGQASDLGEHAEEHGGNSLGAIQELSIFSYYRDDSEEAGGLKVKWTIRVATGAEARRLDERQNHAIRELLTWAAHRQHKRTR
jgi:hypothetical protein